LREHPSIPAPIFSLFGLIFHVLSSFLFSFKMLRFLVFFPLVSVAAHMGTPDGFDISSFLLPIFPPGWVGPP
jgi:hypothetical protein